MNVHVITCFAADRLYQRLPLARGHAGRLGWVAVDERRGGDPGDAGARRADGAVRARRLLRAGGRALRCAGGLRPVAGDPARGAPARVLPLSWGRTLLSAPDATCRPRSPRRPAGVRTSRH